MKQYNSSPWGEVQYQEEVCPGVVCVGTAGHGGLKVEPTLNKTIPDYMRNDDGWYEEDCDWAKVYVALEAQILFAEDAHSIGIISRGVHKKTLLNWAPDAFEQFYDVPIEPGQSYIRDKQLPA